jgi:hypothetical protein
MLSRTQHCGYASENFTDIYDQEITLLYVWYLEESCAFYVEMLGLPLVLDQGSVRILRTNRSSYLGVDQSNRRTAVDHRGVSP